MDMALSRSKKCDACGARFPTEELLTMHEQTHELREVKMQLKSIAIIVRLLVEEMQQRNDIKTRLDAALNRLDRM